MLDERDQALVRSRLIVGWPSAQIYGDRPCSHPGPRVGFVYTPRDRRARGQSQAGLPSATSLRCRRPPPPPYSRQAMTPRRLVDSIAPRIARIRAPLSAKFHAAFLALIGNLVATGLASLFTRSRIERQAADLERMNHSVELARQLDHSIVTQEHLSSMFLLTGDLSYYRKLLNERTRFRSGLVELGSDGPPIEAVFTRYEEASEAVVETRNAGHQAAAQDMHIAREHVIAHE